MRSITIRTVVPSLLLLMLSTSANAQASHPAAIASPYASELSLSLETQGRLEEARAVLRTTYGTRPAQYVPCVRLAWLSLRLHDYAEASALYQRARTLPDALPEATTGFASSLAGLGYSALAKGTVGRARQAFSDANAFDSANVAASNGVTLIGAARQLAPELWYGSIAADRSKSSANVVYVELPAQFNAAVSGRLVYRTITGPASNAGTVPFFGAGSEVFAGLTLDAGKSTFQVVGFNLSSTLGNTPGGAASVRYGAQTGMTFTAAAMSRPTASNSQFAPVLFRYAGSNVFSIGARFTADSSQLNTSAILGGALHAGSLEVDIRGHVGHERSSLDLAGPTILSFNASTSAGGTLTLGYPIARSVHVYAQGQYERLATPAVDGDWYRALAAGVRYTIVDGHHH